MESAHLAEIYVDGACSGNPGPAGIGAVLFLDGATTPTRQLSKYLGEATNNIAEYLALVYALQEALHLGCRSVKVYTDSELLVRQLHGTYKIRNSTLRLFYDQIQHLAAGFQAFQIEHIPRTKNRLADRLATQAVSAGAAAGRTLTTELHQRTAG